MEAIAAMIDPPSDALAPHIVAHALLPVGGPELNPGDVVGGKYLLLRQLGAGGMGQVWMARNSSTGAEVAVKALLPGFASSDEALARFRDEAHATARLAHRGIVQLFDLVEVHPDAGSLLIVMELLRGHTLAERLASHGPLSVGQTLAIVLPILSALTHAHGAGVVHRDVKPDNVFLALEPDGQISPKLVDFGISQLREWGAPSRPEGIVVGTPWYMSPEQARGEEVDARCDVFGVGVLLYECLSGTNPFHVVGETSRGYRWDPAAIQTVPPKLWAAIARAIAKRPEDRFATASELADALIAASEVRGGTRFASSRSRVLFVSSFATALVAATLAYQSGAHTANAGEPDRGHGALVERRAKVIATEADVLVTDGKPSRALPRGALDTPRRLDQRAALAPQLRDLVRDPGF